MDIRLLDKIPNWLRWILFLPVSFLAMLIVYAIVAIGNKITMSFMGFGRSFYQRIVILILANLFSSFSFIWVGATVVPKKHFIVSIVMSLILIFMFGFMLFSKLVLGIISVTWLEIIITCITGGLAIYGAVYSIYQKEIENTSNL